MLKYGSKLLVANGSGSFSCWFIEWLDDVHMKCINKFGSLVIISQNDVEEFFV